MEAFFSALEPRSDIPADSQDHFETGGDRESGGDNGITDRRTTLTGVDTSAQADTN